MPWSQQQQILLSKNVHRNEKKRENCESKCDYKYEMFANDYDIFELRSRLEQEKKIKRGEPDLLSFHKIW